jgi:hypothetical protein
MSILVLTEQEIRQTVSMPKAMEAIEESFAALARSKARLPDVIGLEVPEVNGEIHVSFRGYNAKLSVSFSQTKPNGMFRRSVSQPQYIAVLAMKAQDVVGHVLTMPEQNRLRLVSEKSPTLLRYTRATGLLDKSPDLYYNSRYMGCMMQSPFEYERVT